MNRAVAEAAGRTAERRAAWLLRLKGYRILALRARGSAGEIDIVARRGKTVAFVEVKHRSTIEQAAEAISGHRLNRVVRAAVQLAPRFASNGEDTRIDAILMARGKWPRHLTNIWHG
ncbi:MAG: YraN family protein [Sphingomonas sp.]|nr:YraN family protein [Sphingomonas sp.]RZV49522.1 MAG: YraN family protein [Sphingomonadaceae bacterium]